MKNLWTLWTHQCCTACRFLVDCLADPLVDLCVDLNVDLHVGLVAGLSEDLFHLKICICHKKVAHV